MRHSLDIEKAVRAQQGLAQAHERLDLRVDRRRVFFRRRLRGAGAQGLRSATPGFESCENIGLALPGVSPVHSFTDTTLPPGQGVKMFYKIQLEPQP